jgi:uridine kinase
MEIKIQLITGPRERPLERTIEQGTALECLVEEYKDLPYMILAAKVDNKLSELTKKIERPCKIEFLDMRDQAANLIYQSSLSLLYLKAIRDVLGKVYVEIENSLNKGLYTEVKTPEPITEEEVRQVEERMHELVRMDLPFVKEILSREETLKVLLEDDHREKTRMLQKSDVEKFPLLRKASAKLL